VTFDALGRAVANEWHLPTEIIDSMRPLPPGPQPAVRDPRDRLTQLIALSNELTEALVGASSEVREGTLDALKKRFGRSLPLNDAVVLQAVETALSDVRAYARSTGHDLLKGTPAAHAVGDWLRASRAAAAAPDRPSGPAPPEPPSSAETPSLALAPAGGREPGDGESPYATILAGIQDITQAILEDCALNDILVMVLETAYRGLGFSRVVLFIREPKHGCMVARFGLGPELDQLLPRLHFCPAGAQDPFAVAVREQRDLVHEVLGRAAVEELPEWYRGASPAATFALLPLVVNRVCLGLVYADRDAPGRTITPTEMGYLHTLRNQAVLAVKQRG
jgi:hypothetical protein